MAESWAKDSRGQSNHSGEASSAASAIGSIDSRDASNHARARARAGAKCGSQRAPHSGLWDACVSGEPITIGRAFGPARKDTRGIIGEPPARPG